MENFKHYLKIILNDFQFLLNLSLNKTIVTLVSFTVSSLIYVKYLHKIFITSTNKEKEINVRETSSPRKTRRIVINVKQITD